MSSQKKLNDLLQKKCAELVSHNQELDHIIRELEAKLVQLKDMYENDTEKANVTVQNLHSQIESQQLEIENLKAEINLVNDNIAHNDVSLQIGNLSETAAVASRLQKSGKTFTEVVIYILK
jgi:hypothetical protein